MNICRQLAWHRSRAFVEPYIAKALELQLQPINVCAALRGLCCRFQGTVGQTEGKQWCSDAPYCQKTLSRWFTSAIEPGKHITDNIELLERMRTLHASLQPTRLACAPCRDERKRRAADPDVDREAKRRRFVEVSELMYTVSQSHRFS